MVKITTFCRTQWFRFYLFIKLEWCIKYEQTIHDRLLSYNFKYHQFAHKPNISVSSMSLQRPWWDGTPLWDASQNTKASFPWGITSLWFGRGVWLDASCTMAGSSLWICLLSFEKMENVNSLMHFWNRGQWPFLSQSGNLYFKLWARYICIWFHTPRLFLISFSAFNLT